MNSKNPVAAPVATSLSALMLALALALPLAGCGASSDPESIIAKADRYRVEGDHRAAIIELKNLVQRQPESVEARRRLGTAYLDGGVADRAEAELTKALALGAERKDVQPLIVKALILQGKFDAAVEATRPERKPGVDPSTETSAELLNLRAQAQLAMRRVARAKESIEAAMALQPDYVDGMLTKARVAIAERELDEAAAIVVKARTQAPGAADAWVLAGDIERLMNRDDAARSAYRRAIELDAKGTVARLNLAALEINARHYDAALAELDALQGINPKHVIAAHLRAVLELRRGKYTEALAAAKNVFELTPRHVPTSFVKGVAELVLAQPQDAEKDLKVVLEVAPKNLLARMLLAEAQLRQERVLQAIATLEPAIDISAPVLDPSLLALAADAYMQNKQYARATRYFETAIQVDPWNASSRIGAGIGRMAMGEAERAVSELEVAVMLGGTEGTRAAILLAMSHLSRNQFDQALDVLIRLERTQPGNPLIHNYKAAAYMGKRDTAKARAEFERALQLDPAYFPSAANLAQLDLQLGNAAAARERYQSVLRKDAKHVPSMLALADIASRGGQDKDVLEWLKRAKEASSGAPAPYVAEVDYFRRKGQTDRALKTALELKSLHPRDPDALAIVGKVLLAMGETAEAQAVYVERVALLPQSAAALLELADAQMAANYPLGAATSLRNALRLKPDYREAQIRLVAAELAQGRDDEALLIAKRVQYDLPESPLGYELEGDVLMSTRQHTGAAALYEKAYGLAKLSSLAIKANNAWISAGKPETGEARVKDWLKANPVDVKMRRNLAYTALVRGQYPLAIEQYRLVLERQPGDPVATGNLAFALYKTRDASALRYAKEAHTLDPAEPAIMDTLAQALIDSGELAQGIALLEKAVAAAPTNHEIRLHFAQALLKSGSKASAIGQLQTLVASNSSSRDVREAMALLQKLEP